MTIPEKPTSSKQRYVTTETGIERVRELAEAKEDQNWRFRTFIKGVDLSVKELDSIAHRHYKDIARRIDCSTCANCCKEVSPKLSEADVTRLASCLGISFSELTAAHLRPTEDGDAYCFRQKPCPFLQNNRCTVYDARPDDCRSFPHLHKDEFVFRLIQVVNNCSVCPIVYNVFERLKKELWHSKRI